MAEQLNDLLEQLRHDGFSIGVPETLRLHQLLLALVDREVPLDTPERLTRLLGPVLCRSASQQEALGRHVAAWWPGLVPVPVAPAPADPPPAQTGAVVQELAAVERRRRRLLRWLPSTPAALAIWAAVATGVGVGGALELQRRQHQGTQPAPPPAQVTPAREPALARPSRPAPRPATRPATPAPTTPATPAAPVELARDNGLFLLPSEIAFLALLAVAMALVAVQGAIRGWWWRQARLVLQKLPHQGDGQLHRIALQTHDHDLVPAPELQRLGRALNIWQRLPSDALDGDATVAASLRQGGWLSPRYGQR
ncbi:MAG: hypothetical protein KGQ81_08985, partial [Cyanobacteria bacterium REEB498]|nr:hypothetical protein [Cyanobacteria bacterium REEB498]